MTHTLHVISHTHWDREWYLTFQQFRMRLVDLVDNVLDLLDRDPEFRYFNLDAQTIVLEDYLAIKPQNRARLEAYIREGRITIGPWYQLNDEFLTSGEATVRSLLVGHRIAQQQFGACLKIGYLPDQFGNLSQMPQIFRGFGIDNAILGRGYQLVGDRKMEFLWESPDGSQVTASLMAFWYNNAQHFPADSDAALKYTQGIVDRMAPRSAVSHLLLMNGVDHLEAQQDLSPILRAVNERLPAGTRLIHSTLPQYMDAVKAETKGMTLEKVVGELREDRGGSCLAGTLSSRMYLKQANHHAQITLEKYAEPLSAFALLNGTPYPYDFLHYAWKLLMHNHPHDSICGCSVDQVHREMLPRFQQVEQIGEELISRALDALTGHDPTRGATEDATCLTVFNTLNWARTDPVITTLEFSLGPLSRGNPTRDDSKQVRGFKLTDPDGKEVPFAVTNIETTVQTVLNPVELPLDQWVQRITIEFVAEDVPACGYKTYTLTRQPSMPTFESIVEEPYHNSLDNEPSFEDVGDVGDEYLYRAPLNDVKISESGYYAGTQNNPVRDRYFTECTLTLPQSSDPIRRAEETADLFTRTSTTYWAGVPRAEYKIEIDNTVRDHRLRALFLTRGNLRNQVEKSLQIVSESAFDVIERPAKHPLEREGALPFYPQQFWMDVTGQAQQPNGSPVLSGSTVINRGLPEYEIYNYPRLGFANFRVAVTLLRCVGQLSGRGDGPGIQTPDAQCLGKHTFELAVYEHEGDWKEAKVWKQAHQFNTPLRAVQSPPDAARPAVRSFVTVEPDTLVVTALKRAEDDPNTLIVRFFNITDAPVTGGRIVVPGAKSAQVVNLNEEAPQALTLGANGAVTLDTLRPKQIVTLAFRLL